MKALTRNNYLVFTILSVIAFAFYYSILDNSFFSDDFSVIKRLVTDKQFWAPGFFRPLSDITLLFCYNFMGTAPSYQYLFNIMFLILTSFCIYRFCILFFKETEEKFAIGLLSAILFILYPFHNEAVIWAVGRASLLAVFFGILSLIFVFSDRPLPYKVILANIFFFTGLSAYESIFPLPAIILILLYAGNKPVKSYLPWLISLSVTFFIHLVCRFFFAGVIFGNYQQEGLHLHLTDYLINFAKAFLRLWVLPLNNSLFFIACSISVIILITAILYVTRRDNRNSNTFLFSNLLKFFASILVSLIVPSIFSVSIKTSEGDRLLFFPSLFVTICIAILIIKLRKRAVFFYPALLLVTVYFVYGLISNNQNWKHASDIIKQTISQMGGLAKDEKKTEIINLPDSYYGAYIFRHGFKDALLMDGIDTSKINYIAPFMRWDYDSTTDPVSVQKTNDGLVISNYCKITAHGKIYEYRIIVKDTINYNTDIRAETLWFWDKHHYKVIELQ